MTDDVLTEPVLTEAQAELLAQLRDGPRPTFPEGLRDRLLDHLVTELETHARRLEQADDTLWVAKHGVARVLGCERNHVAEEEGRFEWSVPVAVGSVAHKAIEYSATSRLPRQPLVLVTEAIGALTDPERSLGAWLETITEAERAELVSRANNAVAGFLDAWPPLRPAWRPRLDARFRAELFDGRIVLATSPDLVLGEARGQEAGELVVDLKSGRFFPAHRDDVRFYALVHTLRLGVPPFRIGTFYLETARLHAEDVTIDVLDAAVRRTVDAVERMLALRNREREPSITPGPACGWCPARHDCDGPALWARQREEQQLV